MSWQHVMMCIGMGIVVPSTLLYAYEQIEARFKPLSYAGRLRKRHLKQFQLPSKIEWSISVASGLLLMGMGNSLKAVFLFFLLGSTLGLLGIKGAYRLRGMANRTKRIKNIGILLEAVELYVQAGYSLFQALRAARLLTPEIAKELERCFDAWPIIGPQKALEQLGRELVVPEATTLVALLTHIEASGSKDLKGILSREARSIQRLQKMRAEVSMQNKPLLLMLYRFLPLIAIAGMVSGTLLYRTYSAMGQAGISPF